MSRKSIAALVALNALRGRFAPIPIGMDVWEVLREMPEMGGVKLSDSPKDIAGKAQRIKDSRVTYLAVNKCDGDLMITMLVDMPERRQRNEAELFAQDGYAFAYVYNNNAPYFSEYGDVVIKKYPDKTIHRVG